MRPASQPWFTRAMSLNKVDFILVSCSSTIVLYWFIRVKCHFSPCGLGHFVSLVQRFHSLPVGSKRFHRCHFSLLS
ncbi:hypothetical protein Hanom_Chr05g00447941 [Helianthus anomalus]